MDTVYDMKTIAIIDDNTEFRDTLKELFDNQLENDDLSQDWHVISAPPLQDKNTYSEWINTNDISVILIDERLDEARDENNECVDYYGSGATKVIRKTHRDIPIYVVTSFGPSPVLEKEFGLFEAVIERRKLTTDLDTLDEYLRMIIRSSERYTAREEDKLAELGVLAEKITSNTASEDEKMRVIALQEELLIPFTAQSMISRQQWTAEYDDSVTKLESLKNEIEQYINNKE